MFPHPQTLQVVRAMEREQLIAQIARERRGLPRPGATTRFAALRRAARMLVALVG